MSVRLYIARNHLGQFSCGHRWVDDFKNGRFYTKRGPISTFVTQQTRSHPSDPVPDILSWEIDPSTAQLYGSAEETKKRVAKVNRKVAKRKETRRIQELEYLKEEEERLAARRKELTR